MTDATKVACSAGTYRDSPGATASTDCVTCPSGYYAPSTGTASCSACPEGFSCSNPAVNPVQCSEGSYTQGPASTSCSSCPAGYFCVSPNTKPTPCPRGTYSSGGASSCTICPNGQYTTGEASSSCTNCPAGYKCPQYAETPIPCPSGTYSNAGSGTCHPCPSGKACMDPSSPSTCPEGTFSPGGFSTECVNCAPGTYSSTGAGACTNCEAGYECPDRKASTKSACASGYYSPPEHGSCVACPPGTEVNSDQSGCVLCPAGSECAGGSASATTCSTGYFSPLMRSQCIRCLPGLYSSGDGSTCLQCPPGKYCAGATAPVDCPDGYYSLGGASVCTPAPAGTYVADKAKFPSNCVPGEYSSIGSTSCTSCPAGMACTLPTGATSCPGGYTSVVGEAVCEPCPLGYECPDQESPVACGTGKYSNVGDPVCHDCPPGFYCAENSFYPIQCPAGTYSASGAFECTPCTAGSYCPDPSATPIACPDGTYSNVGQYRCTPCPQGSSCPSKAGDVSAPAEQACPAGFISAPGQTVCQQCPAGMACPDSKGFNPIICSPGHYSLVGQSECSPCPAGYSCSNPSEDPVVCPAGTFSSEGAAECTKCPAGYYCTGGTASPRRCAQGTYSLAGESSSSCQTCEPGFDCYAGSTSSTPDEAYCPLGYYCPAGVNRRQCPAGTYGVAKGQSTQGTACATCPAGYYCATATSHIDETIKCPRGYYCPEGTTYATEYPCPEGTYNPTTGAVSEVSCRICPAGYYCDSGTDHYAATPCAPGFYCPEGTESVGSGGGPIRCPKGTYYSSFGAKNATDCSLCPPGKYCGGHNRCDGSFAYMSNYYSCPRNCPAGTFNSLSGAPDPDNCLPCPDGFACPTASAQPTLHNCYPGYFCREGAPCTIFDTNDMVCYPSRNNPDLRCPAGTYTTSYHLKKQEDCSICWAGYACPSYDGTLGCTASPSATNNGCPIGCEPGNPDCPPYTRTMIICSAGHYCPGAEITGNGSNPHTLQNYKGEYTQYPDQYDCPPGTYSSQTGLKSADECTTCERGKFCVGGQTTPDGDCPAGYYCPRGTQYSTQYACPAGTYSSSTGLYDADDCISCPEGAYCPAASTAQTLCPAGTYNPSKRATSKGPITIEAALQSTSNDAAPTFEQNYDVEVALTLQLENEQCITCPPGYKCDSDGLSSPVICPPGTYSDASATSCTTCPVGHFCARNGTRGEDVREEFICPAGVFCPAGTDQEPDRETMSCPVAKYCPRGTSAPIDCPAGSFNPNTGVGRAADCLECPRGQYCEVGSSAVTGNCSIGYYCPANSTNSQMYPCPANTYHDREQAFSQDHCAVCPNGKYCPEGTGIPIECPQGYYCIIGISIPAPCPMGTYGNSTGLIDIDECTPCDAGYYCDTLGRTSPSGKCDAGYYCLLSAETAAPRDGVTGDLCPRGGFCPIGSSGPSSCAPGTFNNYTGGKTQADCAPCTPGYYCAGSSNPYPSGPCSPGYYCISDDVVQASNPRQFATSPGHYSVTGSKTEIPCAAGTYTTETAKANGCDPCEKGFYCPTVGIATRDDNPCPAGSYCPEGSILPIGCPAGTYGEDVRFQNASQCTACPVGKFCDGDRLTAPVGDCLSGYICYGSSQERNPVGQVYGDECPVGHWCAAGTNDPVACAAGTYNPVKRSDNSDFCLSCPAGHYCQGTALSSPTAECSAGYYCPSGLSASTSTPASNLCSIGKYCPQGTASQLMCGDGEETLTTGRTTCQPCASGVYCSRGSQRTACPQGRYCEEGTGLVQSKCPPGTYSNTLNLQSQSECTLCASGKFCSGWGLTVPDGNCLAGTYCVEGASDIEGTPGVMGGSSSACPIGHYCPSGASAPSECPVGTFASTTGLQASANCQPCSAGYYCPNTGQNTTTHLCGAGYYCTIGASTDSPSGATGAVCPVGHYCPQGSPAPVPCPDGYYQDQTQQSQCDICPEGYYCGPGSFSPIDCPAGHFCPNGTGLIVPKCPKGSYSSSLNLIAQEGCTLCDGGKFCSVEGLTAPDGDCKAGISCTNGASDESGTPGVLGGSSGICPEGHYCEKQTTTPIPCPVGTFANWTGNTNLTGCSPCRPGYYCDTPGLPEPLNTTCSEGYYCVLGATSPTPTDGTTGDICPAGTFCLNGTVFPIPCPPGTYTNTTGSSSCDPCPEGFYCEGRTVNPAVCPAGFYCPNGTTYEVPECPSGSYSTQTGLIEKSQCTICSPGYFCSVPGLNAPDGLCAEGFYCSNGSLNSVGTPGELGGVGGVCPPGYYCPAGSPTPVVCGVGTYNPNEQQSSVSHCLPCPGRKYCPNEGMTAPAGNCTEGYYCTNNEVTESPSSKFCPTGHFCPNATAYPHICVDGTYQDETTQASCKPCPAGKFCVTNSSTPQDCPVGSYCPEGYGYPIFCADGTYSTVGSLSSQSQCLACPAGKFCTNGQVRGPCHAGYVCYQSSWTATPKTTPVSIGELCPIGFYCPEGTINPTPCPAGTVGTSAGGRNDTICGPCPKGYYCIGVSNVGQPCPPGKYCPPVAGIPVNCPNGTYNPITTATNATACLPCEEGYTCPDEAQATYTDICPLGHYCPQRSIKPIECPEGTFRNSTGGAQVSDCSECLAGHYCESATSNPVLCSPGTFCIAGSKEPVTCPAKYYCLTGESVPRLCPAGSYCPEGISSPVQCPFESYCPAGTDVPVPCPYGYRTRLTNLVSRTTLEDSCEICPAGTYGNTTNQIECYTCDAGYVCLSGATAPNPVNETTQRGYKCPAGAYCPAGSTTPTLCPAGTYRASAGGIAKKDCLSCEANSYSQSTGATECRKCGTSSTSAAGATSCNCVGANRVYQESDGTCLCKSGYTYYDDNNQQILKDSTEACIEIVYSRCASGETHDSDGNCVSSTSGSCASVCTAGGKFVSTYGICECSEVSTVEEVCDSACRASRRKILYNRSSGKFTVTASNGTDVTFSEDSITVGSLSQCTANSTSSCELHVVRSTVSGFMGIYNPSATYLNNLFNASYVSPDSDGTTSKRQFSYMRALAAEEDVGILHPVVCLSKGSGILFDVSDSKTSYPQYATHSLLNTVSDFDYGSFRELAQLMPSDVYVKTFAFFFSTPGTYVFNDASQSSLITVVRVLKEGETCTDGKTFLPLSESNLVSLGISALSSIPLTPDWRLIGLLLLGFFSFCTSALGCLTYFKSKGWVNLYARKQKKISELTDMSEKMKRLQESDASDFDINLVFDELDLHSKNVTGDMANFRDQFTQKYDNLLDETKTIRSMLERSKRNRRGVVDVNVIMKEVPTPASASDLALVIDKLSDQLEEFEFERRTHADYPESDDSDLNYQQRQAKRRLMELSNQEKEKLSETVNAYTKALDELRDHHRELERLSNSQQDVSPKLAKVQDRLDSMKKNISSNIENLNDTISAKNQLEDQMSKKSHLFNLTDESADQLRDFLTLRVKEMFDKYQLNEVEDLEGEESDDDFGDVEDEVEAEEEEGLEKDESKDEPEDEEEELSKSAEERFKTSKKKRQKDLVRAQKREMKSLDDDINAEYAQGQTDIIHRAEELENDYTTQMQKAADLKLQDNQLSPQRKQQLLDDLNNKTSKFSENLAAGREEQMNTLKVVLEKKKRAKAELIANKQEKEREMFLKMEKEEKQAMKRITKGILQDSNRLQQGVSIELLKQKEILEQKLANSKGRLQKKQQFEQKQLQKLMNAEDKLDRESLKEHFDAQHKLLIDQKKQLYDDLVNQPGLSREEKNKLSKENKSKLASYKKSLGDERKKAEEALEEEIAHRRNLKQRTLDTKHAEEEKQRVLEQEKDLKALRALMDNASVANEDLEGARSREKLKQARAIEQKLAELKQKHKEKKRNYKETDQQLDAAIAQEIEEETEKLNRKFALDRKNTIQEKEDDLTRKLQAPDITERKKEQLLATHRLQIQDYEDRMASLKDQQIRDLHSRLNQKLVDLKRQKKMEQQKDLTKDLEDQEKQLDKHVETSVSDLEAASIDMTAMGAQKLSTADAEFEEMERKRTREDEATFEKFKRKTEDEYDDRSRELQQQQQKKVFALKSKMQADLASSSGKEKERIIADYSRQLDTLERKQQHEQNRQAEELAAKLEAHRKKLQKKREKDLKSKRKEHGKEQESEQEKQRSQAEHKKILDLLMDDKEPVYSIEDAINRVVVNRHKQAAEDLAKKQARIMDQVSDEAKRVSLELKHTKQRVKLKQQQLAEKKKLAKEFEQYNDLLVKGNDQTRLIEEQVHAFASQINKEKDEIKKKLDAEKEKLRQQMEKEIEDARKKSEEERRLLEERLKEEKNKLQVKETIHQREQEIAAMLDKQKDLEKSQRENLLQQHKADMDAFEDALEAERKRQERILANRIRELEKKKQKEGELRLKQRLQERATGKRFSILNGRGDTTLGKVARNVKSMQSTISLIHQLDHRGPQALPEERVVSDMTVIVEERKWMEPILQKIRNIEKLLALQYPPYCDQKDLAIRENEGKLVPVPVGELNIPQLVVYKFGEFIIHLLRTKLNIQLPVRLAIASSLPHTDYAHNAFKHSFYYQIKTSTLFIRDVRLAQIGKFIVILTHCMAHITFGELESDLHPDFIKNYYSMMEVIFEDIFNVRNRSASPKQSDGSDRSALVNQMVDLSARPLRPGDGISQIRLQPGRTEVDVMTRHAAQKQAQGGAKSSAAPQYKPRERPKDRTQLQQELLEAQKTMRNNQQHVSSHTANLKKVDEKLKQEETALNQISDTTSLDYRKQQAKVKAYQKKKDDIAKQLKSSTTVHNQLEKKIKDIQSQLSSLSR